MSEVQLTYTVIVNQVYTPIHNQCISTITKLYADWKPLFLLLQFGHKIFSQLNFAKRESEVHGGNRQHLGFSKDPSDTFVFLSSGWFSRNLLLKYLNISNAVPEPSTIHKDRPIT